MATVFKVEKTRDYTVMSNHHLRDPRLSLKAKGLLSQMLSLPEDWDYTLDGLARINKEGKDAIRAAVNELEKAGYVRRRQTMDAGGHFSSNEYIIYERPLEQGPPDPTESPSLDFPATENPSPENPTQLNIDIQNTDKQKPPISPKGEKPCPLKAIQEAYNAACGGLPKICRITGSRLRAVQARWRESPSLEEFDALFLRAGASPFLTGQNPRGWRADFDWLMRPNNWAKVMEGKYDGQVSELDTGYHREEDDLLL